MSSLRVNYKTKYFHKVFYYLPNTIRDIRKLIIKMNNYLVILFFYRYKVNTIKRLKYSNDNMKYKNITYYRLTKRLKCDLICNIEIFQKIQSLV